MYKWHSEARLRSRCVLSRLLPSHLVVRHLLQVKVCAVDDIHACVAVVVAIKGTPLKRVGLERIHSLMTSLKVISSNSLNDS